MSDIMIKGHCDERFHVARDAFAKNFEEGLELGATCALSIGGEMVLDLWGGYSDLKRLQPWKQDTIAGVMSSSKVVAALCALMLIDRGLVELDEPVATYWPEFAANGKQAISVRSLLSHTAGLAGVDGMPGLDDRMDWHAFTTLLAAQKPWWEPGTQSGYHAFTWGHLVGELVRRVSGKMLSQFFRDEVADRLDIDFHFQLADVDFERNATLQFDLDESRVADLNSLNYKAQGYLFENGSEWLNSCVWLKSEAPGNNGIGNAHALAKIGSLLANGGTLADHCILKEETVALAHTEQSYTEDLLLKSRVRWGLGYGMASKEYPLPWPNGFHWGGFGGSSVVIIPELTAAWSYVPSRLFGGPGRDPRARRIKDAMIGCLEAVERT